MRFSFKKVQSSCEVRLRDDGIIEAHLTGYSTLPMVKKLMEDTRAIIDDLKRKKQPVLLLIDVSRVTGQASRSRSEAKKVAEFGADKIAVYGRPFMKMVGQYILRSGGMSEYSKIFSSRASAIRWLSSKQGALNPATRLRRAALFATAFGSLISLAVCVGWATGSPALAGAYHHTLRPMDPGVAVVLLALCLGIYILSLPKKQLWPQRILLAVCICSIYFALAVLAYALFGLETYADTWLYAGVGANMPIVRASPLTAVCLLLLSCLLLFINRTNRKSFRLFGPIVSVTLASTLLIALIGYCYDLPKLYALRESQSMSLSALCTISILTCAVFLIGSYREKSSAIRNLFINYWPAISIFTVLALITGFMWQQSRIDLTKDRQKIVADQFNRTLSDINNRGSAYISTLRDYKAFFASSGNVTSTEFDSFAKTAELAKHYPGVIGLSYVRSVPQSQVADFTNTVRTQESKNKPFYSTYTVHPTTKLPNEYPLLFSSNVTTASILGFNLASDSERRLALERARDTGDIAASPTINLNASRGPSAPKRNGFFITIPIYKQINGKDPQAIAERRDQIMGMVNAYVEDKLLFTEIFKNTAAQQTHYVITDTKNNETIFTYNKPIAGSKLQKEDTISIGGQHWKIALYTTDTFGLSANQQKVPYAVLAGGLLLAALASILIVSQTRRREQAYKLASHMTEDLNNERNTAVTLQQKDEAILSSIGDAVFAIDRNQKITLFNHAAERISGYDADEAIGKTYTDILTFQYEGTGKQNVSFIEDALKGKMSSMKNHTILIRKDGYHVSVADSAAPIWDAHKTLQGVIVVFRDVSKEYELDKAKTEFVSLASHQLRTPLSAINWYSEMLLDGDAGKLDKEAIGYVREIYEGNQRMIELVNSLLDVSRLDLGKLTNNPEPTDMVHLAESLEKELQTTITAKQQTFTKHLQSKLDSVEADPKLLRMILQNLLSNAVKYTPEHGTVTLEMHDASLQDMAQAGIRSHQPHLFISVSDNGYGIPAAQQHKIFSKLFRADNVRVLDVEGTGLGLYIVKEVLRKLGGKVWFVSKESIGTTFFVVLPYKAKRTKK